MPKEVDPKNTTRAAAYALWMKAPNPMVTFFKTFDVTNLIKVSRKRSLKFNMLLDYCIGRAAVKVKEFYILPVGEKLMQYDTIAVNTIVKNKEGEVSSCDLSYNAELNQFNEEYLKYTAQVAASCQDRLPALNLKYAVNPANSIRFSASRTVTRPSFIEMAPFLYQESYGSAQIRGNEELQNGYNYNFDLRYERFGKDGDMLSVTGYFKYLDSPIERIQDLQGGATLHSFKNADNGMAAGVELEMRKRLVKDLRLGANISYMYTNVKLPQGGAYTNKERSLQGASPILANADLTYSPRFGEDRQLNLALLYNLQGSRIHAVGVSGLGDVRQQTLHTLNFSAGYSLNKHFNLKLQVNDLLNRDVIFKQDVPTTGQEMEVERYRKGTNFEVGISYNL